jgi:hypothetical protein
MEEIIKLLKTTVEFDLENGPFITGGYALRLLEEYADWEPEDIDICCMNNAQFDNLKNILCSITEFYTEGKWHNNITGTWIVNGIKIDAGVTRHLTVEDRLAWNDFNLTAIAYDGKEFKMSEQIASDIKNRILRINGALRLSNIKNNPNENINMWIDRYYKYTNRKYKDTTGIIETLTQYKLDICGV